MTKKGCANRRPPGGGRAEQDACRREWARVGVAGRVVPAAAFAPSTQRARGRGPCRVPWPGTPGMSRLDGHGRGAVPECETPCLVPGG